MHVKMFLKRIAQVARERGRKFHKWLKQELLELYHMFEEYTQLPTVKTKKLKSQDISNAIYQSSKTHILLQ